MKYRVQIEEPAWRDIDAAYEWLHARVPEYAIRWFNTLEDAILVGLGTNPERCGRAPESDEVERDIRQLFHGKRRGRYRVLFEVRGYTVHVLHVRHGARRLMSARNSRGQSGSYWLGR